MINAKESKRRKISKFAFTTLNSFSAVILLGFMYFLHNKGLVESEVITKVGVASLGTVCGISIVTVLAYLKEKADLRKLNAAPFHFTSNEVKVYNELKTQHDQELDQIIAALQARKYEQ